MRNDFEKALKFRHACKLFDETKMILGEDLNFVLEAGRLSPSSFGMEHWHFFIIRDLKTREEIRKVAWNQPQITTCSELIAIAYRKNVRSSDKYIQDEFNKFNYDDAFRQLYAGWIDPLSDSALECWSSRQVYIAAGNMMTAAASIGIDSCPIEGFEKEKVESIINIDTKEFGLSILLPLGYRASEQHARLRSNTEEIVTYL